MKLQFEFISELYNNFKLLNHDNSNLASIFSKLHLASHNYCGKY